MNGQPLLAVDRLSKTFRSGGGLFGRARTIRAVHEVSFAIARGESLGLVGESGSGKTTLGRLILRLLTANSGTVHFDGTDVLTADRRTLRALRRRMQIVFQDSAGSLNPRMTIGSAVREPMTVHRLARRSELDTRVRTLFGEVGLDPILVDRYPHELSGGQRQRVGIARALSVEPKFVVLDEPVSALDVSVQAQVLNLLADLRERRSLTYLFIAHDLAVVRHLADRVAVMYFGKLVEIAPTPRLFAAPTHPYTTTLLAAIPVPDPRRARQRSMAGEPVGRSAGPDPAPAEPQPGSQPADACAFYPRCPHPKKDERCRREVPLLREIGVGRLVACHYADPSAPDRPPA